MFNLPLLISLFQYWLNVFVKDWSWSFCQQIFSMSAWYCGHICKWAHFNHSFCIMDCSVYRPLCPFHCLFKNLGSPYQIFKWAQWPVPGMLRYVMVFMSVRVNVVCIMLMWNWRVIMGICILVMWILQSGLVGKIEE